MVGNIYVLPALSSQLSVFSKLCIMNTLLHFLLLFQLCRSLRNIPLGGHVLGKSKVLITVGWIWCCHRRASFLVLPRASPILNPPLQTWTPMSLLRTPTKLTDRVENESDVERREKQPTRDEKGGAMLWHVTHQPMKIRDKIGIYRCLCQV